MSLALALRIVEQSGFPGNFVLNNSSGTYFFYFFSASSETMAKVQVLNVAVLDNPSRFRNPFQFEITFECMEDLPEGKYQHKVAAVNSVSESKALCWLCLLAGHS